MTGLELKKAFHQAIDEADENTILSGFSRILQLKKKRAKKTITQSEMANIIKEMFEVYEYHNLINNDTELDKNNPALPGKPYTVDKFRQMISEAEESIKRGEFITHEDLKKEVLSW